MSVQNLPEGFNYSGKYGAVYQNSIFFDDMGDKFKKDYILNKIVKLRIWSGQKNGCNIVYGIQVSYKNISTGEIISTNEYKGAGFEKVEDFEISGNEYLNKFNVRFDKEITQVGFETSKGKKILVGSEKGDANPVKLNNGNNIIVSLYGNYNECLESIGVGYVDRNWYVRKMCFGYFELRYLLKKDENFKKQWIEKMDSLDNFQKAMIKTCTLPDSAFSVIAKFFL